MESPGSFLSKPSGHRRRSVAVSEAESMAEGFKGLPASVTKNVVSRAFSEAADALGVPGSVIRFVEYLLEHSPPSDWEKGQRPIVWPTNHRIQLRFGVSKATVCRWIAEALEYGFISMKDSPNRHRRGWRRKDGRIGEAYGFDLSPLAVRHAEFATIVEHRQARAYELRKAIRALGQAYGSVIGAIHEGHRIGLKADWEALFEEAREIYHRGRRTMSVEELTPFLNALQLRKADLDARIADSESTRSKRLRLNHETQYTTTNENQSSKEEYNRRRRSKDRQPAADKKRAHARHGRVPAWQRHEPAAAPEPQAPSPDSSTWTAGSVKPADLLAISPGLNKYLVDEDASWTNIVEAAFYLRSDLGISQDAWVRACQVLGRQQAAVAVAVIDAKSEQIESPGGYLRAMTDRAKTGELRLAASIYGLKGQYS